MHRQLKIHYKNARLKMYAMFQKRQDMLNQLGQFALKSHMLKILFFS